MLDRITRSNSQTACLRASAFLVLLGCVLIMPYGDFREVGTVPQFWFGIAVMGVGYGLSWTLARISGIWFWSVAILARLLLLPMFPGDDVWRYLWEGYVQTLGFSPYDYAPNADILAPYRTEWWSQINHPGVSAIYPPVAQLGFRMLAAIAPAVWLFKLAFIAADLAICWLLSRRFGERATLIYAWNPLVIYSFAGGAHYDSWFILPLVGAWLLWEQNRDRASALLVGTSIALKWMSLPILGFLSWRELASQGRWQQRAGRAALLIALGSLPLVLCAIPFCYRGECPLIPVSSGFVSSGRSAELLPYLLSLVWPSSTRANWIYALPLGAFVAVLSWRSLRFRVFSEVYFYGLIVLSPIVHAWYFTWLVPFAVASRNWGASLGSLSVFVYFVLQHRQALGDRHWFLTPSERAWLWLPFLAGTLWTLYRHWRSPEQLPD